MSLEPQEVFDEARSESVEVREKALEAVHYFIENKGTVFEFEEAVVELVDELGLDGDVNMARSILSHLVSDDVDPVTHVVTGGKRYVFVSEFFRGGWWYGYEEYHDVLGPGKKIVCSQCVLEGNHPSEVGKVFEHDKSTMVDGKETSIPEFESYDGMAEWMLTHHFHRKHPEIDPDNVGLHIGASLATGTTIASNASVHGGNLSSFPITGLGVGTLADGEFLKRSGSSIIGGQVLQPEFWPEDGNSPRTQTGVGSDTYTLASSYDVVFVLAQVQDPGGASNIAFDLRFNGDSGANYNYLDNSDTRTAGANEVPDIAFESGDTSVIPFIMGGRITDDTLRGGMLARMGGQTGETVGWQNGSLNSSTTLDSLTILGSSNFDITWEVRGRDIGPGGPP